MKRTTLDILACPSCHGELALHALASDRIIESGTLVCAHCQREYPIKEGIIHFIEPEELTGLNRRFARFYDLFTHVYFPFNGIAFFLTGGVRKSRKEEILKRLDYADGRVLEVSIGPGVNLPYLFEAPSAREVYGLDISLGQLRHCQRFCRRHGLEVDLLLGTAEALPFKDNTFDAVFHVGGINFFNDKKAAIDEMIRVAKPGTRIVIADENEKAAKGLDVMPGASSLFGGKREPVTAPVALVPPTMQEVRTATIWSGMGWVLDFKKPAQ